MPAPTVDVIIDCPEAAGTTPVLPGVGTIIACGDLETSTGFEKFPIVTLYAVIYGGIVTPPPSPPAGAVTLRVHDNGPWGPWTIPGAVSGPPPTGAANTLAIWAVHGSGAPALVTRQFTGVPGSGSNCCGSGSGSGGPPIHKHARGPQSVAVTTAPLLWTILAAGFEAGKSLFNGQWALTLRPVAGGVCVWDNGGDEAQAPLVELRCESPLATTWRLSFRHGPETVVEYTRAATEWNTLAANVVHKAGNGVALGTVPTHLTVTPG